jgi:glucose-1-phosphate thymidylyltransferase
MKAVVLARGKGTRMQQADDRATIASAQSRMADLGLKAMIPFRRPFLDYVLSALADGGVSHVCLIVGPEHDSIRDHYDREHPPSRLTIDFAVQDAPLGTANALMSAREFAGDDPFLALNSDNYYPPEVVRALVALDGPGLPVFDRVSLLRLGNVSADRMAQYAVLVIGADGSLEDIVEKPDAETLASFGSSYFVSMNCWRFDASIFEACARVAPSGRGELELPNAVRYAIRTMKKRFRTVPLEAGILDLSRRADIAEVERRLASIDPNP